MALYSKPGERMSEHELKSVVEAELRSSNGWVGGEISELRREALQRYFGEPFGNEIEGRSSFVSTDTQDVVESVMPDLMEIFGAGEAVVEFEPTGEEDVQQAKQKTDYINHIWVKDNPGFEISYDWMKDAILQKNGIIRIDWDNTPVKRRETLTHVTGAVLTEFEADDTIEIVEQEESEASLEDIALNAGQPLFDLVIIKTFPRGRVKVHSLPPEEFLISRRAVDIDDSILTCHKVEKTVSDLLELGYSRELIDSLPSHDEQDYNEERVSRFNLDDEWPDDDDSPDYSLREIWLYDVFMKVDFDGDGIAELRNIKVAGPGYKVLPDPETGELALEVDDHPFVDITPIRMPHKFFGRSLFELTADIEKIKTTIIRQLLDNMYLVNNNRAFLNERVNLDDWLTNRPGGAVRVRGDASVGDAWSPIQTPSIGAYGFPLLEWADGARETRTGITRYNQGLDADSLNKTATGINQLLNQSQKRLLLIARLFAETGFKKAFKKILRLVINNQDAPRTVRMRGKFVQIDPRAWNADMDLTVRVGLGHGTKEMKVAMLGRLLAIIETAVKYQGGVQGPLVNLQNIYNALKEFINASGQKPASQYITDPESLPPEQLQQMMQPRLNPEVEKVKMEHELKMRELDLEDERERIKIQMEDDRARAQLGLKERESEAQLKIKARRDRMEMNGKLLGTALEDGAGVIDAAQEGTEMLNQATQQLAGALEILRRPKRIVRDATGQVVGTESV